MTDTQAPTPNPTPTPNPAHAGRPKGTHRNRALRDAERLTRNRPSGMTPHELDAAMTILKTTAPPLARALGVQPRTVYGWRMGDPIPAPCAILIRLALVSDDARRKLGLTGQPKRRRMQFELHAKDHAPPRGKRAQGAEQREERQAHKERDKIERQAQRLASLPPNNKREIKRAQALTRQALSGGDPAPAKRTTKPEPERDWLDKYLERQRTGLDPDDERSEGPA